MPVKKPLKNKSVKRRHTPVLKVIKHGHKRQEAIEISKETVSPLRGLKNKLPEEPINPLVDALKPGELAPPPFLNPDGLKIWHDAVDSLVKMGELAIDHAYGLENLAYMWQRIRKKMKNDQDISASELGAFRKMLFEYGLTPMASNTMDREGKRRKNYEPPAPAIDPATNPFEKLKDKLKVVSSG